MKSTNEIAELLWEIPYFKQKRWIPPLDVMNDLMRRGVRDAGMSGHVEWKPFELSESEYLTLVQELRRRGLEVGDSEPPPEVNTYELWSEWCLTNRVGDNAAELAQLYARRREAINERRLSEQRGDHENVARLWRLSTEISARISEILANNAHKEIQNPKKGPGST